MSLDSPADIIPFTRFLERRERLRGMAASKGTVVTPASTDSDIQPHGTARASAEHDALPRCTGNRIVDA
jgi:hypothetical protein